MGDAPIHAFGGAAESLVALIAAQALMNDGGAFVLFKLFDSSENLSNSNFNLLFTINIYMVDDELKKIFQFHPPNDAFLSPNYNLHLVLL